MTIAVLVSDLSPSRGLGALPGGAEWSSAFRTTWMLAARRGGYARAPIRATCGVDAQCNSAWRHGVAGTTSAALYGQGASPPTRATRE